MAGEPKSYFTPDEYLELERKSPAKSEYFNGEIFAMSGASPRHVLIVKPGRGVALAAQGPALSRVFDRPQSAGKSNRVVHLSRCCGRERD